MECISSRTRKKRPLPPSHRFPALKIKRRLLCNGYSHLRKPFVPHCLAHLGLPPEIIHRIHYFNEGQWIEECRNSHLGWKPASFFWVMRELKRNTSSIFAVSDDNNHVCLAAAGGCYHCKRVYDFSNPDDSAHWKFTSYTLGGSKTRRIWFWEWLM